MVWAELLFMSSPANMKHRQEMNRSFMRIFMLIKSISYVAARYLTGWRKTERRWIFSKQTNKPDDIILKSMQ